MGKSQIARIAGTYTAPAILCFVIIINLSLSCFVVYMPGFRLFFMRILPAVFYAYAPGCLKQQMCYRAYDNQTDYGSLQEYYYHFPELNRYL